MATGIEAKIFNALAYHMSQLVFSPAIPVAYPNVAFSPPATNKWLALHEFPAPTVPLSVDNRGANQHVGFAQISVFWPLNTGMVQPNEIAASIISHFKRGTRISRESIVVEITQASRSAALYEDRVMIPVTINYRSFHANPA